MNAQEKFLRITQFDKLNLLSKDSKPDWGIMTSQHMVEHLSSLFLFTIEKVKGVRFFNDEKLKKNYNYLIRDRNPFHKNVKLPGLEDLPELRFDSLEAAIIVLEKYVEAFYAFFEDDKTKKTMHPAMGMLNFQEWEWNHYAHSRHHLFQFALIDAI
ncbi:MAG: hypothetical protein MK207_11100 [Saprospiraceae bacterium]|nr:hypothetical protein [Saprospiraceae bacterium]